MASLRERLEAAKRDTGGFVIGASGTAKSSGISSGLRERLEAAKKDTGGAGVAIPADLKTRLEAAKKDTGTGETETGGPVAMPSAKTPGESRFGIPDAANISGALDRAAETRRTYYSPEDLYGDADYLYADIADVEGPLLEKQRGLESAAGMLGTLYERMESGSAGAQEINAYNALVGQYGEKYEAFAKNLDAYNKAVSAYGSYLNDQGEKYDRWKATIRDQAAIEAEIAAIDAQLAEIPSAADDWRKNIFLAFGASSETGQTTPLYNNSGARAPLQEERARLQEELGWARYLESAEVMKNEDFEEKSGYVPTGTGEREMNILGTLVAPDMEIVYDTPGYEDPLYDWINGNEDAGMILRDSRRQSAASTGGALAGVWSMMTDGEWQPQEMSEDEVKIFNYIYATQGKEAAHEYYEHLRKDFLNQRLRKKKEEQAAAYARENKVGASLGTVIMSPFKMLSYAEMLGDYISSGEVDQNAPYNMPVHTISAARNAVAENWGPVGSTVYQLGMSFADSIYAGLLSGSLFLGGAGGVAGAVSKATALAIMGMGAAADMTVQAKDRGLSDDQAFALGAVAGAAEIVMEKIGLDELLKSAGMGKGAVSHLARVFVANGGEEVGTDAINLFADIIISQDESEWRKSIEAYMANGDDETTAFWKAFGDQALAMGVTFIGGGFMAGAPAAVNVGVSTAAQKLGGSAGTTQSAPAAKGVTPTAPTVEAPTLSVLERAVSEAASKGGVTNSIVERVMADPAAMAELGIDTNGKTRSQTRQAVKSALEALGGNSATSVGEVLGDTSSTASGPPSPQGEGFGETVSEGDTGTAIRMWNGETVSEQEYAARYLAANPDKTAEDAQQFLRQVRLLKEQHNIDPPPFAAAETGTGATEITGIPNAAAAAETRNSAVFGGVEGISEEAITEGPVGIDREASAQAVPGVRDLRNASGGLRLESPFTDEDMQYMEEIAQAAGVVINIVEASESADGWYENGQIFIPENTTDPVMEVAKHEVTHHLKRTAPKQYAEYLEHVKAVLTEEGTLEAQLQAVKQGYAEKGVELTDEGALDEVAANFTERLLIDRDMFLRVTQENRGLAQRLLNGLKEFIRKVRNALSRHQLTELEQAQAAWEAMLKESRGKTVEADGQRQYLFAGKKARTANLEALVQAQMLANQGADNETVRQETGWFRGADSEEHWEIDDSEATYHKAGDARFRRNHPEYVEYQNLVDKMLYGSLTKAEESRLRELEEIWGRERGRLSQRVDGGSAVLADLLDHPALFEAYPELAEVPLRFADIQDRGQYDRRSNTITVNERLRNAPEDTLIHEIQHAIQQAEGFSPGASPEYWSEKLMADRRREVERADAKHREIFESMPEDMKNKVREYNRSNLDQDYDRALKLENELLEGVHGDLFSAYLEADFDRRSLRERQKDYDLVKDAFDHYHNTAGEIEARDAAKRRTMTAQQRRETRPDLGDENTVFAEGTVSYNAEVVPFRQQIDDVLDGKTSSETTHLNMGKTPDLYSEFGFDTELDILVTAKHIKSMNAKVQAGRENAHDLSREKIAGLPRKLADPVIVMVSKTNPDCAVVVTDTLNAKKEPVIVALQPDGTGNYMNAEVVANIALSGYGKEHFDRYLTSAFSDGRMLFCDYAKSRQLQQTPGVQFPNNLPRGDFTDNVAQFAARVKANRAAKQAAAANKRSSRQNSLRGIRELEKQAADLAKQNQRLKAQNERLKGQMKRSAGAKTDEVEVKRTAGKLLKDFGSRYDRAELAGRLQALYDSMADPDGEKSMTEPEMRREAQSVARDILSEVSVLNDDMYREYSELRKYLRNTKINVPRDLWGDLDSEGGYNEFRKHNMGRLSLSSTEGRAIEDVYQELSYDYPGLFDQDAVSHPADQLVQLAEVAGNLRPTYENPYAADQAAMDWLAGEIMERFYDLPQQKATFADRAAKRVNEVRQQERKAAQERLQKALADQERRHQKKIANIKESNRQAGIRMRENMTTTKLRDTIKRHAEGLSRKLLRPTDKQHIPERLRGSVLALLEVIDLESKYGYEFTREATFRRVNREEGGNLEPTKRTDAARALKAAYEELRSDPEFNGTVDPDLADKLEEIAGMGDIRVADMNREQLQTVWEAVRAVEASVTKSDKMLGDSKYAKISAAADQMRAEVGEREDRKNLVGVLGRGDRMLNLDMLTPETFLHRLGKVGDEIHRQMRRAQDRNIEILNEGVEVYKKAAKETGVDMLKAEKEHHTFELPGGTIDLTTAQVMDLYALSKRKAATEHIYLGGLRAQGGKRGIYKTGKSKPVKVTYDDVATILKLLSPEQKALMDRLQGYVSGPLAAHGNEASMETYGYEKFKEKNYWRIKVSPTETDTDPAQEARAKTIPGFGMTKTLKPHANNSVILRSALDTYGEHLNQMATYAAWLTTSENITKLQNYDFMETGTRTGTVKELFEKVYGEGGGEYLENLLSDIAQGTKTGAESTFSDALLGRWKAAKVGANIRVILQQPTAIIRAAEMINAKYLATAKSPLKGWKAAERWAPIAKWKNWGYFEMDTGRSMRDLMAGTEKRLDKAKDALMAPAGAMDSFAWGILWNAVEAETADKRTDLREGSDEFYRAVAERFGDIIDRTQVVDSVLHRTQIMRSSNAFNRLATSFMSEPSKIYNMVMRDVYDLAHSEKGSAERKRAAKHVARTGVALVASFVVNAVAQSLADALRDDDRDKGFLEKFGEAYLGITGEEESGWEKWSNFWSGNLQQNFDPLGYLPYIKDIESIVQGYTVDRSDMEGLADLVAAGKALIKSISGEGGKTALNTGLETACKALDAIGIPASNIKRDVMGVLSTGLQWTGAHVATYRMDKLMLDIENSSNSGVFYDTLYRAMNDDFDAYVQIYMDMVASGMDPEKIASGMEKRMAKELNLEGTLMLPVEYAAPGEDKSFDQMVQEQLEAGRGWADTVDSALVELAYQVEALEPEEGADGVTNYQRQREIADQPYDEDVKELSMERVMSESAYEKYMAARDAKISTYDYMNLLDDIKAATLERRGESGSPSQDDVIKALRQSGLTNAQKRAVWYSYGWKSESPWG